MEYQREQHKTRLWYVEVGCSLNVRKKYSGIYHSLEKMYLTVNIDLPGRSKQSKRPLSPIRKGPG